MKKLMICAVSAALLLVGTTASAEMYRWVDADGEVHYSDRAVAGSESVNAKKHAAVPAQSDAAVDAETESTGEPVTGDEPQDEVAQVKAKQCELAKQRKQTYESSDSIIRTDEAGKKVALSAEERVDAIMRARKDVRAFCEQLN